MQFSQKKLFWLIISAMFLIFVIALFVKFPYYIKGPCEFSAQHVWSLTEVEPGKLMARLSSNGLQRVTNFHLLQFDRPDFVNFSLTEPMAPGRHIKKGTLIGSIASAENRIRFEELQGQLDRARAQLAMIATGQKQAVQQQAQEELNYARSAFELYRPTIERKRQLAQDSLISRAELEQAEAKFKLLKLNVSIAAAKLNTVQSGDKTEAVNVLKSEISSIENQLRSVEAKLSAESIRTPIEGILLDSYQPGSLCTIAKIDTMIVQIPIDQKNRYYVKSGMKFQVKVPALANQLFSGDIISMGQNAQMVNNRMMFILIGRVPNPDQKLLPGMTGYVKIHGEKTPLWMLMKRWWHSSIFHR